MAINKENFISNRIKGDRLRLTIRSDHISVNAANSSVGMIMGENLKTAF